MAWDVDTGRIYLEIPDNSKDQMIQDTMDRVVAEVESKLQRSLFFATGTTLFPCPTNQSLHLRRYPDVVVASITDDSDVETTAAWRVDAQTGVITFDWPVWTALKVTYDGGYVALPRDLEWAMWEIVTYAWNNMNTETGGPAAGGGATTTQGSGEVSRVTLQDFGTLTYDVGTTTSGGDSDTSLASQQADWGWLSPWAGTLQIYRSDRGVGLGIA